MPFGYLWDLVNNQSFYTAVTTVVGFALIVTTVLLFAIRYLVGFAPHLREASAQNVMEASLTIVGTLASVVIAFILFAVWTRFEQAKTICDQEAAEASVILNLASNLPDKDSRKIKMDLAYYLVSACHQEWDVMHQFGGKSQEKKLQDTQQESLDHLESQLKEASFEGTPLEPSVLKDLFERLCIRRAMTEEDKKNNQTSTQDGLSKLWQIAKVPHYDNPTKAQQTEIDSKSSSLKDRILDHQGTMSLFNSQRMVMSKTQLPGQIWGTLIICTIVMTVAICLIWVERLLLHLFNALLLSGVVTLVLMTTSEIDNPFQGDISVKPIGLLMVLKKISDDPSLKSTPQGSVKHQNGNMQVKPESNKH